VQVDFYHLAASPVERALTRIAERLLGDGGRLLVVCGDDALAARIDRYLWTYAPDSFLPHGRAGDGQEAGQPVLIAPLPDPLNAARHIALADGVWRDDALAFDRAFHFFDDATIAEARTAWKALGARDGISRNFWKQDQAGRWTRAA
jgi:DNA polymerase-3 subunit chi